MRGFIKICGAIFVIGGMIGFVIAFLVLIPGVASGSAEGGAASVVVAVTAIVGSAAITLIGGTAFMLCKIDERLERSADATIVTTKTFASHNAAGK